MEHRVLGKSTNEPVRWFPVRHKGLENSKNLNYVRFSSLVTLWTEAIYFVQISNNYVDQILPNFDH